MLPAEFAESAPHSDEASTQCPGGVLGVGLSTASQPFVRHDHFSAPRRRESVSAGEALVRVDPRHR